MNILVFKPNPRFLDYTLFTRRSRQPVVASRLANFRSRQDDPADFSASLERINFICSHGQGGKGFTRNCVTQRTAVEINQTQIQLFSVARQEAYQQFVRVTETHVDFAAGVAAFQAF